MTTMTYARQQLFHWVGSHIEKSSSLSANVKREMYVDCLRDFLRDGFRMKLPRDPDVLPSGTRVTLPITCFTDWDLRGSGAHTARYGRLGFGVTKQFVLAAGGHPVTYAHVKSPLSNALANVRKQIERSGMTNPELASTLEFIAHFTKRIQPPAKPRKVENMQKVRTSSKANKAAIALDPGRHFLRSWGIQSGSFLEEREWRIVYGSHLESIVKPMKRAPGDREVPGYFLKPTLGHDVVTVVLPDNAAVHLAMTDKKIREALAPTQERRPHVALISLAEVGTY